MSPRLSAKARQAEARELLLKRDHAQWLEWANETRAPLRTLSSLLFDPEPLVIWRTIEAFGVIGPTLDQDSMHRQLQRFFWMMNDESGAICWYAPEAIAETLATRPEFMPEFGKLLLSFLIEEPFESGVCWGTWRLVNAGLAESFDDDLKHALPHLAKYLCDKQDRLRGMTVLALTAMNKDSALSTFQEMTGDQGKLEVYDTSTGELESTTVGILAQRAIATITPKH